MYLVRGHLVPHRTNTPECSWQVSTAESTLVLRSVALVDVWKLEGGERRFMLGDWTRNAWFWSNFWCKTGFFKSFSITTHWILCNNLPANLHIFLTYFTFVYFIMRRTLQPSNRFMTVLWRTLLLSDKQNIPNVTGHLKPKWHSYTVTFETVCMSCTKIT